MKRRKSEWLIAGIICAMGTFTVAQAAPPTTNSPVPPKPAATATAAKPVAPAALPLPSNSNATPVAATSTNAPVAAPATVPVSAPATNTAALVVTDLTPESASLPVANPDMVCPVLPDEKADPKYAKVYNGKIYYLCCSRCVTLFTEHPQKYADAIQSRGTIYADAQKPAPTVSDAIASVAGNSKPEAPLTDNERIIRFCGYFHPLLVHFPIALIVTAALSEFFLAFTGRRFFAPVSLFCIRLAAVLAILTALSGWAMASGGSEGGEGDWILDWHRWLGIGTAAFSTIVAIISLWINAESDRVFYRWMLYIAAAAVAVTGHFGGMLVYGQNYFRW